MLQKWNINLIHIDNDNFVNIKNIDTFENEDLKIKIIIIWNACSVVKIIYKNYIQK